MFRNPDQALRWAASIKCRDIISGPSINRMYSHARRSTDNPLIMSLSLQEAQLQAEMIFKCAYDLGDRAYSQYIDVRYLHKDEMDALSERVLSMLLYSGGVHRRDISKLILAYCGTKVTRRELGDSLHCRWSDIKKLERQVYDSLDAIHYRVMGEIESKMIESVLVYGSSNVVCS